jgi:undecaprenyl-diphosphatase
MNSLLHKIDELDRKCIIATRLWQTDLMTSVMRLFTESARGYAWSVYALILFLLNKFHLIFFSEQRLLFKAMYCPLLGLVLGKTIKLSIKRKRPYQSIENFQALTHSPLDDSFPSLHATSTISFFTGLYLNHQSYAGWILVWALIVIFSRLYLGVHYLSDLIGGILLGFFCGFALYFMEPYFLR